MFYALSDDHVMYPPVLCYVKHTITQRKLTALSQVGAWGDMEKPQQDMTFNFIAPSLSVGCKWVFSLTTIWVHPHQTCLPTLVGVAWKVMLLANEGTNLPHAYAWMNDTMAHIPLSSEGHIGIMTGGLPRMNACGHLNQLQVWR